MSEFDYPPVDDLPAPTPETTVDFSKLSPELREAMETAHERNAATGFAEDEPEARAPTYEPTPPTGDGQPVCVFCDSSIPSFRHAYRRVTGWETPRRQGGTNAIRLRQPLDEYACSTCIDAIAAGRSPAQEAIL